VRLNRARGFAVTCTTTGLGLGLTSSRASFAKLPEFHRFCLQTAVNHANAAGDGFPGKSIIVIKSLLLVSRANIAGSISH
jgi:hypothetical protein